MTTTTLPRAATSPELVKLRADNQSAQLYLTIHSPTSFYTAKLAAVPTTTDKVASITYDTGSGTHTNIKADMTMLVGSTAGASDRGIVRIRNTTGIGATTGTFNIGETSQINWTSGDFLTVLDEFGLWPRHVNMASNGTTPLMDYDVAYTNQNVAAGAQPTPIMGPHAVLWLIGTTVTYSPDATSSWVKDGTITTYAWVCVGSSFDNAASATPVITFSSTGLYRLALTVTGNNTITFTGYRYVFVVTESSGVTTQFTLDNCSGDTSSGGWQFGVTLYAEATKALVRDRALCILHSIDYYGSTRGSVGYVTGNENIVALGYIAGESIVRGADDQFGSVSFEVQGPQYWFGKMTAFPSGVKDVSDATTPNKWTKFRGLTLNKAWYHFLAWRTTATRCMDVYPNTDGRRHKRLEAPGGQNIWAQLVEICKRSMLANPLCDRYGRIFCEIEQQLVSDRSGMATIQALTSQDWQNELRFDRVTVDEAALIDLSGISWSGTAAIPYFSLAPGHVFRRYGSVEVVDRLMLTTSQTDTNTLAGLYSAWKNNPYPKVDVKLASHHRLIDIAPYQRVTLALASTDTPRGLTEALTLIPRTITYNFDNTAGVLLVDATFEAEVTAALSVTGDTPVDPPDDPPIDPTTCPPGQHWDGAACVTDAPIDPPLVSTAFEIWILTVEGYLAWSGDAFAGGEPSWNAVALPAGWSGATGFGVAMSGAAAYLSCTVAGVKSIYTLTNIAAIRAAPATAPTWTIILTEGDSAAGLTIAGSQTFQLRMNGNTLTTKATATVGAQGIYGEYSGSAWSFTTSVEFGLLQGTVTGYVTRLKQYGAPFWCEPFTSAGSGPLPAVYDLPIAPAAANGTYLWRNLIDAKMYHSYTLNVAPQYRRIDYYPGSGSYDVVATLSAGGTDGDIRGAWNAAPVWMVDNFDGKLYTSLTGAAGSWTQPSANAVWTAHVQRDIVMNASLLGTGTFVWVTGATTNGNEIMRYSSDNFATAPISRNGDWWTAIQTSGSFTLVDMWLVYT